MLQAVTAKAPSAGVNVHRPTHPPVGGVPKFDPVTVKVSPTVAGFGDTLIWGTTVNGAVVLSPRSPVTRITFASAGLPEVATTNDPWTLPPLMVHEKLAMRGPVPELFVIWQVVSSELKPEPVTVIVSPPVPLLFESVIVGVSTLKVAETDTCNIRVASVIVTVCSPGVAVGLIVNVPVRMPFASILQENTPKMSSAIEGVQSAWAEPYPEPERMPADRPGPPLVGLSANVASTPNVAVALSPPGDAVKVRV